MPAVSRLFLKTSLVLLMAGSSMGFLLFVHSKGFVELPYSIRTLHHIFMAYGWLLFFVFGTAIWMFPKVYLRGKYGNAAMFYLGYTLLWGGMLLHSLEAAMHWVYSCYAMACLLIGAELARRLAPLPKEEV